MIVDLLLVSCFIEGMLPPFPGHVVCLLQGHCVASLKIVFLDGKIIMALVHGK